MALKINFSSERNDRTPFKVEIEVDDTTISNMINRFTQGLKGINVGELLAKSAVDQFSRQASRMASNKFGPFMGKFDPIQPEPIPPFSDPSSMKDFVNNMMNAVQEGIQSHVNKQQQQPPFNKDEIFDEDLKEDKEKKDDKKKSK